MQAHEHGQGFCKHDTEGFEAGHLSGFQYFHSKLLLARVPKWEKAQC